MIMDERDENEGEKMIIQSENINIMQIADSGQCFRMNKIDEQTYNLIAYGRYIELTQLDLQTIELSCSEEEFHEIWEDYFDLTYDYQKITQTILIGQDEFLKKAVTYGGGIRILKQEPFEMLISFIISQNKNIPAIKNCVELICKRYGEEKTSDLHPGIKYYTFPSADRLALASKEELRELKTGYRDQYIKNAAKAIANSSIDLNYLMKCSYEETITTLKKIPGVGDKVASCVALYGLHHIEAFPVDVWIARVLKEVYNNNFDLEKYKGYAGIVQQYMFYYMRSIK